MVLSGIQPKALLQNDLFSVKQNRSRKNATDIMDKINKRIGSNTIQLAGSGLKKDWQARCTYSSPQYTTNWKQLAIAYAH